MNTKYFLYALALTIVTTVINWSNAVSHMSSSKSSSSYNRTGGSSMGGGSWGGGGHK
jgi:hypothetical protein